MKVFKQHNFSWSDLIRAGHRYDNQRLFYVIIDEIQMLYNLVPSKSPAHKSTFLWSVIKGILSNGNSKIKVLMLSAYGGSNMVFPEVCGPIMIEGESLMGIEHLLFSLEEVREYVIKWFDGIDCLINTELHGTSAFDLFCNSLELLTEGHIGLCVTVIALLNQHYDSNQSPPSTAAQLITMLRNQALFPDLFRTLSVAVLDTLSDKEMTELEQIFCENKRDFDCMNNPTMEQCVRNGILFENDEHTYNFASPAIKQYFFQKVVRPIPRASVAPKTLDELMQCMLPKIDYKIIKNRHGRNNNFFRERTWQLEFYKALHRSTSSGMITSADGGSSGYIDFTIDSGSKLWGVELLRETDQLQEDIKRFARYSPIPFDEYCIIDFRNIATTSMDKITQDLRLSNRLLIVSYDTDFTNIILYDSNHPQGTGMLIEAQC